MKSVRRPPLMLTCRGWCGERRNSVKIVAAWVVVIIEHRGVPGGGYLRVFTPPTPTTNRFWLLVITLPGLCFAGGTGCVVSSFVNVRTKGEPHDSFAQESLAEFKTTISGRVLHSIFFLACSRKPVYPGKSHTQGGGNNEKFCVLDLWTCSPQTDKTN